MANKEYPASDYKKLEIYIDDLNGPLNEVIKRLLKIEQDNNLLGTIITHHSYPFTGYYLTGYVELTATEKEKYKKAKEKRQAAAKKAQQSKKAKIKEQELKILQRLKEKYEK